MQLPALVFGAATFSAAYGGEQELLSDLPVRTVRLALRYARMLLCYITIL